MSANNATSTTPATLNCNNKSNAGAIKDTRDHTTMIPQCNENEDHTNEQPK